MSKKILNVVFILILLLQGCASIENTKISQSDEIRESLFKYLLVKSSTKNKLIKMKVYYFLRVEGKDPSENLMKKIKSIKNNVYPTSQSKIANSKVAIGRGIELSGLLRHKTLGGIGISYGLGKIKFLSKNKVTVSWGSYLSGLNASHNIATLELINAKWVVTSSSRKAIAKSKPNKLLNHRTS